MSSYETGDTLTMDQVIAVKAALDADEPEDADISYIDMLSCGHTICIPNVSGEPYIMAETGPRPLDDCCLSALNAKWV